MEQKKISKAVLKRLPGYLAYLKNMPEGASPNISATALANALDMGEVQSYDKSWAVTGTQGKRRHNIVNSLSLLPEELEQWNIARYERYHTIEENERLFLDTEESEV